MRNVLTLGLAVALLFCANGATAQDLTASLSAADCGLLTCRDAGTAMVVKPDQTTTQITVAHSPYVTRDGVMVIYPGETLAFNFPTAADTPSTPQFFSVIENGRTISPATMPNNVLAVSFGPEKGMTKSFMSIQISHDLPRGLSFDMTTTQETAGGLAKGAVACTVAPNAPVTLRANGVPGPILLSNFRYAAPGTPAGCK